jgi:opacity protein-like surface antigen
MSFKRILTSCCAGAVGAALLSAVTTPALGQGAGEGWQFALAPYLWAPSVDSSLRFRLRSGDIVNTDVEADFSDILENVDFAFMFSAEARKGRWLVFTDVMYMDLSVESESLRSMERTGPGLGPGPRPPITVDASLDAGTENSLKSWVWTLAVGYTVVPGDAATLDVFGGLRYLSVEAETDWRLTTTITGPLGETVLPRSGSVSREADLWDGIVGVGGRVKLGTGRWFLPYYADVGAGDAELTWQVLAGVGYAFGWGDVVLAYRHFAYEQDDDKLVQDLSFGGVGLGAVFRF